MKKFYYLLIGLFLLSACNPYKKAIKEMERGDYANAFDISIKVFQKNKSQKKQDKQLILLQKSYLNANEEDENILRELKLDINPNYKDIYIKVKALYDRINTIKPFLPLYNSGKELKFPTPDYTAELAVAKENYLNEYYNIALDLLGTQDKVRAREAYQYLTEIKSVDRYYRDVQSLQNEAFNLGADIVLVTSVNQTGVPFPTNFTDNLLYSLNSSVNDFWTVITTNISDPHDYEVSVILRQAFVGNDILTSNTYNYEKNIQDGWEDVTDRRGNIVRDSLGRSIKKERYVTVRAQVTEYVRHKEAMLSADIQIYNSFTGTLINNYPVASNFVYNTSFATVVGDRRALDNNIIGLINSSPVPFPSNYDMISECGIKIRRKLIDILSSFN